jgi:hypothetical protein
MNDWLDPLGAIAETLARDARPEAAFAAVEGALQTLLGHRLFTVLLCRPGDEVERAYSSDPTHYPLGGRKRFAATPWGELVLKRRQPFLGPDRAALRWAYADHALIESLGLGSAMNVCVEHGGDLLAVLALLHVEGHFHDPRQVATVRAVTPVLIPALRALRD